MEVDGINESPFGTPMEEPQLNQESLKKCGNVETTQPSVNGCFDCNICLDFAADPVVTLCGHLFCWPCIYKWLQVEATSSQPCPVCKASLSQNALVPLYGRGHSAANLGPHPSIEIPRRPSIPRDGAVLEPLSPRTYNRRYDTNLQPLLHRHQQDHLYPFYSNPHGDSTMLSPSFERMMAVLPWMFSNQDAGMDYRNSYYYMMSGGSPRLRRQEMRLEKSLHQFWFFLLCCAMLCLFLF